RPAGAKSTGHGQYNTGPNSGKKTAVMEARLLILVKGEQRRCRDQSNRTSSRICSETFGVWTRFTSRTWIGSTKSVQPKRISSNSGRVECDTSPASDLRPKRKAY